MSAQGYPGAGTAPKQLEREMDMIRDKPVQVTEFGANQTGPNQNSARGVPAYYYDTNTQADMRMKYRMAAANQGRLPDQAMADLGLAGSGISSQDSVPGDLLRNFKVELTPQDVEWLEERRRTREQIDFDDWLTRKVDISDPAENRWLQEKYPEFWSRRERFIDDKINIEARLAKIRLRGANSVEDYKLLFATERGYITPAVQPLWSGAPAGGAAFRTGWLSLLRESYTNGVAPTSDPNRRGRLFGGGAFKSNPVTRQDYSM
jgi:hypothetical protein